MRARHVSDLLALRSGAWKESRAAAECIEWEAAMETRGKSPRTRLHYAYTVWDLLEAHPEKAVDEFTAGDLNVLSLQSPFKPQASFLGNGPECGP